MASIDPPSTPNPRRSRDALLFAALWFPYALLVQRFWFVTDDAYISFRYARNLTHGLGLRYNAGEEPPVEGYSNFLWTLYAALIEALGLDVGFWAALLSAACGSLLLWLVYRALVDALGVDRPIAGLATLSLGCFPPFAVWSTGGLETMPFALALFVTFERLVLRRAGVDPVGGALAALALALLRVEGIAWAVVVGLLAAFTRARAGPHAARPLLRCALLLFAGYAVYYAWRFSYYGLPFPNTVYAKSGFGAEVAARGARYLISALLTFLPIAPLLGCAAVLDRRWRTVGPAVAAMLFGVAAFAVLVGGDFMAMGRFLVPGLPFQALLFGLLLQRVAEAAPQPRAAAALVAAVSIAISLLPAFDVHVVPASIRDRFHFRYNADTPRSEYEQWVSMNENARLWRGKGLALRAIAEPGDSVVLDAIGIVGYYSDLHVFDRLGLVDREVATQRQGAAQLRSPGHDRYVGPLFFLDRNPTFLEALFLIGDRLAPEVLAREAQRWLVSPAADRYAPDFRIARDGDEYAPSLLLVWRSGPQDAAVRWERFFARARTIDWERLRAPAPAR